MVDPTWDDEQSTVLQKTLQACRHPGLSKLSNISGGMQRGDCTLCSQLFASLSSSYEVLFQHQSLPPCSRTQCCPSFCHVLRRRATQRVWCYLTHCHRHIQRTHHGHQNVACNNAKMSVGSGPFRRLNPNHQPSLLDFFPSSIETNQVVICKTCRSHRQQVLYSDSFESSPCTPTLHGTYFAGITTRVFFPRFHSSIFARCVAPADGVSCYDRNLSRGWSWSWPPCNWNFHISLLGTDVFNFNGCQARKSCNDTLFSNL